MKALKLALFMVLAIFLANIALAVNTAVIIEFPDGSAAKQECVYVRPAGTAQDAIHNVANLLDYWDAYGNLTQIGSWTNNNQSNGKFWTFFTNSGSNSYFNASKTSPRAYTISNAGNVIGLIYTGKHNVTNPDNSTGYAPDSAPSFRDFSAVCPEMMSITSLKATVNGKEDTGAGITGGLINKDVRPESKIKLEFKIKNMYTDAEDIMLGDVFVNAVLEGIDNGDDIEVETDGMDINPDSEKKITVELNVPLKVDEGSYSLKVKVSGEDDNGLVYGNDITFDVEVQKERHNVRITKAALQPENVSCTRRANVDLEILNLGKKEEDVELFITSSALSIDYYTNFTLSEDPDDSDNDYSNMFDFSIDSKLAAGSYPIDVRTSYSSKTETKTLNLLVQECKESVSRTTAIARGGQTLANAEGVQVIIKNSSAVPVQAAAEIPEKSNDIMPLLTIIAVAIFSVGIGVLLIYFVFRALSR